MTIPSSGAAASSQSDSSCLAPQPFFLSSLFFTCENFFFLFFILLFQRESPTKFKKTWVNPLVNLFPCDLTVRLVTSRLRTSQVIGPRWGTLSTLKNQHHHDTISAQPLLKTSLFSILNLGIQTQVHLRNTKRKQKKNTHNLLRSIHHFLCFSHFRYFFLILLSNCQSIIHIQSHYKDWLKNIPFCGSLNWNKKRVRETFNTLKLFIK